MTNGSSQGLFVVVAVIIFGIFVFISYLLFRDNLKPSLANIFCDAFTITNKNTGFSSGGNCSPSNEENQSPEEIDVNARIQSEIFIRNYDTGYNERQQYQINLESNYQVGEEKALNIISSKEICSAFSEDYVLDKFIVEGSSFSIEARNQDGYQWEDGDINIELNGNELSFSTQKTSRGTLINLEMSDLFNKLNFKGYSLDNSLPFKTKEEILENGVFYYPTNEELIIRIKDKKQVIPLNIGLDVYYIPC